MTGPLQGTEGTFSPEEGRPSLRPLAATGAIAAFAFGCALLPRGTGIWIRVNQVGYLPSDPKVAVLAADRPLSGRFSVGEFVGDIGPDQGAFGPFRHTWRLDFTAFSKPGRYRVRFGDVTSPAFSIGEDAYAGVPARLLSFLRLQRCGQNPVTGKACHLEDAIDAETGETVDLVGGWHDAADRIKHSITTSWCVAALFLVGEMDEALYGATYLRKIHPRPDALYVQVGDDRDHQRPFVLWHEDPTDYGWGKGGPRAAWPATGRPQGPKFRNASTGRASLAGRTAAALALAGDLDAARSLHALARASPGFAQSVPVRAPYHYEERTWHDDLEWAAVELHRATGETRFLEEAVEHAGPAGAETWMGAEVHGHYEYFPYVNVAHSRLHPFVGDETQARLEADYRESLEAIRRRAETNAFRFGTPLVWCSTNDAIAFATQAVLYERMTGDSRYRMLAAESRDWIFGRNPWGVSFVCGVPEEGISVRRPHHLFHRLANILPVGGLVDGPVAPEINAALRYAPTGVDPYARFQSSLAVYHDDFADFSTNEPTLDGTVSLLLLLRLGSG